ncbi:MAG: DUF3572 family protein [Alphaproteobacteria bacterium]
MTPDQNIALQMFTYIFQDHSEQFLSETGYGLDQLKECLLEPETLAMIMDYMLEREDLLVGFCQAEGYKIQDIWRARMNLPGAPQEVIVSS